MGFADYLGFDINGFPDLYWIAEQARNAPLPEPWTEHTDETGNSVRPLPPLAYGSADWLAEQRAVGAVLASVARAPRRA
jgi:hypothetical protein